MSVRIFLLFSLFIFCWSATEKYSENITISIASEDIKLIPEADILAEYPANPLKDYEFISHYYDTITRKIVLENGKVVNCRVPLYDVSSSSKQGVKRNLTHEEAENVLIHLKDACARHSTKEFLWEYCHEKYARQYDDIYTVRRAAKKDFELFFLGFLNNEDKLKYTKSITILQGDYQPERSYFDSDVRRLIPTYPYVKIYKQIVRVQHLKIPNVDETTLVTLHVYVPTSLLSDNTILGPEKNLLRDYNKTLDPKGLVKKINGEEHIKISRHVKLMITVSLWLLEEDFPIDIITSHATVTSQENKKKKPEIELDADLYSYKNYLLANAAFLSEVPPQSTIFLMTTRRQTFNRTVVQVLDDRVIEFDSPIASDDRFVKIINFDLLGGHDINHGGETSWIKRDNQLWIWGKVITGSNTKFLSDFKKGDIISVLQDPMLNLLKTTTVVEIKNDLVLITEDAHKFSLTEGNPTSYYIGRPENKTRTREANKDNRKSYFAPELSHVNAEVPNEIVFIYHARTKGHLLCHSKFRFPTTDSWMLRFRPAFINKDKSNLMIYLSEDECTQKGIAINFNNMEQIIISNYGEKSKFKSTAHPIIINRTELDFNNLDIWIVYSHGTVRVGYGDELSIQQQLLAFEAKVYKKLNYFSFDRDFSFNIVLSQVNVFALNKDMLKTLQIMNRTLETIDDVSYWVSYKNGTFCEAVNKPRSFDVQYKCSKSDRLMEIEEINEPSTCHYHIVIGTHLLCPKTDAIVEHVPEYIYDINCIID